MASCGRWMARVSCCPRRRRRADCRSTKESRGLRRVRPARRGATPIWKARPASCADLAAFHFLLTPLKPGENRGAGERGRKPVLRNEKLGSIREKLKLRGFP